MGQHVRTAQCSDEVRPTPSSKAVCPANVRLHRPLGGVVGDLLYNNVSHNLWLKKAWITFVGVVSGAFLVAIGLTDPHQEAMMFGLIAGMAFFLEAGNGMASLVKILIGC